VQSRSPRVARPRGIWSSVQRVERRCRLHISATSIAAVSERIRRRARVRCTKKHSSSLHAVLERMLASRALGIYKWKTHFAERTLTLTRASAPSQRPTRRPKRSMRGSPWPQRASSSPSRRDARRPTDAPTTRTWRPARWEAVQVDLADFQGFGPPTEFRYAFVGVDVFTKLAFCQTRQGEDVG